MRFSGKYIVILLVIAGLFFSVACKSKKQQKPYQSYKQIVKDGKESVGKTAILELKFSSAATGDMLFETRNINEVTNEVILVWETTIESRMNEVIKSGKFYKIQLKISEVDGSMVMAEAIKVL